VNFSGSTPTWCIKSDHPAMAINSSIETGALKLLSNIDRRDRLRGKKGTPLAAVERF